MEKTKRETCSGSVHGENLPLAGRMTNIAIEMATEPFLRVNSGLLVAGYVLYSIPSMSASLYRFQPKRTLEILIYALKARDTAITSLHCRRINDGLLYLDSPDPTAAARILSKHSGVKRLKNSPFSGVDMRLLEDPLESGRSLIFPPPQIERGTWVRLLNPRFDGDSHPTPAYHKKLALVLRVSTERGEAEVVTAFYHEFKGGDFKKKQPLLMTETIVKRVLNSSIAAMEARGARIDHGLLAGRVPLHQMLNVQEMNFEEDKMRWPLPREMVCFVQSKHPVVEASFPRVRLWDFHLGEVAQSWDGLHRGEISSITENGVEVGTGRIGNQYYSLGWAALKCWKPGDYVSWPGKGVSGLVIGVEGDYVHCFNSAVNEVRSSES